MRLDKYEHMDLVLWATECAEHVLPLFEENYPEDDRPWDVIEAGRAWVRVEISTGEARAAAIAAHAAARDADRASARAAARACGHTAATAHVATHAAATADYAVKAATEAAAPVDTDTAGAKERSGHTDVFLHTFGLWRFLSETVTEVVGTEHSFVHDI